MPLFTPPPHRRVQPQRLRTLLVTDLLASTIDGGIIVADTTARPARTYTGGGLVPQRFVRPAVGPNTPEVLELAPVSINQRRALNRMRGLGMR